MCCPTVSLIYLRGNYTVEFIKQAILDAVTRQWVQTIHFNQYGAHTWTEKLIPSCLAMQGEEFRRNNSIDFCHIIISDHQPVGLAAVAFAVTVMRP